MIQEEAFEEEESVEEIEEVFEEAELVEDEEEFEVDDFTEEPDEEFGEMIQEEAFEEEESVEETEEVFEEEESVEETAEVFEEEELVEEIAEVFEEDETVEEAEEFLDEEEIVEVYETPKKKIDFPVFKSSLFPNYNKEITLIENNFDEIMTEAKGKIQENNQKEEQMLKEAEALLASLGIDLGSVATTTTSYDKINETLYEGPSRDELKSSLKIDSVKKDILKKLKDYR